MLRKWLAAAVVLTLSSVLLVGHTARVSAASIGFSDLRAALISQGDISDTGLSFVSDDQQTPFPDVLQVIRSFASRSSGEIAVVSLLASTDGSVPPASFTNLVASGEFHRQTAISMGASVGTFTLAGSQGFGDLDQSATFDGTVNGTAYTFYGDSFVIGNAIGIVLYGGPSDSADVNQAAAIVAAQEARLS
jgi:hypothetical protein